MDSGGILYMPSIAAPFVNEGLTINQVWLLFLQAIYQRTGGASGAGVVLTGMIIDYGGSSAPSGWLICDGTELSRTTYAALFAVIGTAYGAGDGTTTFNLPDLRGAVALGASGSYPLGDAGGNAETTLSIDNLPSHSHTVFDPGHTHAALVATSTNTAGAAAGSSTAGNITAAATGIALGDTGSDTPFSNLPPYATVNKIIKL